MIGQPLDAAKEATTWPDVAVVAVALAFLLGVIALAAWDGRK